MFPRNSRELLGAPRKTYLRHFFVSCIVLIRGSKKGLSADSVHFDIFSELLIFDLSDILTKGTLKEGIYFLIVIMRGLMKIKVPFWC